MRPEGLTHREPIHTQNAFFLSAVFSARRSSFCRGGRSHLVDGQVVIAHAERGKRDGYSLDALLRRPANPVVLDEGVEERTRWRCRPGSTTSPSHRRPPRRRRPRAPARECLRFRTAAHGPGCPNASTSRDTRDGTSVRIWLPTLADGMGEGLAGLEGYRDRRARQDRTASNQTIIATIQVMKKVSIQDLKATLSAAVAEAEAGDTIVITRHNRPVARLSPARVPQRPRGILRKGPGGLKPALSPARTCRYLAVLLEDRGDR